jgi:hypothetical protein
MEETTLCHSERSEESRINSWTDHSKGKYSRDVSTSLDMTAPIYEKILNQSHRLAREPDCCIVNTPRRHTISAITAG